MDHKATRSTELANELAFNGTHHHENGDPATNMGSRERANGLASHHHENGHAARDMAPTLKRYPETGISVLIVGSGIGGLMSALECWRKGHTIQILERSAGPVYSGEKNPIPTKSYFCFSHCHPKADIISVRR